MYACFWLRLMHLGKTVYIVGETTTPSIRSNDLLVLGSGSGQSAVLVKIAELARQQGAKPPLFTAETISPLSELADYSVKIPAPTLRPTLAERSYAFLQQGAKGLVHGRNTYQHPNPTLITRAFMAMIHESATAEEAFDIYQSGAVV